jgi:Na+/proline symporter
MNRILRYYLGLAPWELFVLLVVTPVVARVVADIPLEPEPGEPPAPWWYQVFMVAWFAMLCGWFWAMGIGSNRCVREDIRPGSVVFNLAVSVPVLALLAITMSYGDMPQLEPPPSYVAVVGSTSLVALACVGYTIRFVAKNLWLAEKGRAVAFRHYGGTLFMLMFFPVALWFVQPRVREVCKQESSAGGE